MKISITRKVPATYRSPLVTHVRGTNEYSSTSVSLSLAVHADHLCKIHNSLDVVHGLARALWRPVTRGYAQLCTIVTSLIHPV